MSIIPTSESIESSNSSSTNFAETPIKYLLLGDASTLKIITEFQTGSTASKTKKEINQIFSKICKSQNKKYDERNKITSKTQNYYFTITKPDLVFLVLAEQSYPERLIFQLIEAINELQIPLMINDETNELNPQGRQELKDLVDKYQDQRNFNKIAAIQNDVDNIKIDMKNNINKMVSSIADVKDLENKSDALKNLTEDYKKTSVEVRKVTWWQNFKMWIILGAVVLLLILIIIWVVT